MRIIPDYIWNTNKNYVLKPNDVGRKVEGVIGKDDTIIYSTYIDKTDISYNMIYTRFGNLSKWRFADENNT